MCTSTDDPCGSCRPGPAGRPRRIWRRLRTAPGTLTQAITWITQAAALYQAVRKHETLITEAVMSVYAEMGDMVDRVLNL
ncbi:hypothetical protein [Paractinoplanes atraurantiacus]|uniref:Uncharacterized protein n=1 Tax=Paractinoplanes atraurantiacus TaxID=1036182 RepID=A0A285KJK5_9ACTN|nr:hypothetical protein [Actinoplanes atraurantiacus]SNY72822.1 hypothetical protein SAMN05421748_14423 [Actinoplanes atraurantiacus]